MAKNPGPPIETVQEMIQRIGLNPRDFDYVVMSDGSATTIGSPGGFAAFIIDLRTDDRHVINGAFSNASVIICETAPFWLATHWIGNREEERMALRPRPLRGSKLLFLSDSQTLIKYHGGRAMQEWWTSITRYANVHGLLLTWQWVKRESCGMQIFCDHVSRFSRVEFTKGFGLEKAFGASLDLRQVNPHADYVGLPRGKQEASQEPGSDGPGQPGPQCGDPGADPSPAGEFPNGPCGPAPVLSCSLGDMGGPGEPPHPDIPF